MSDTQAQPKGSETKEASLQDRTVETIKEAHALLTEQDKALTAANSKVGQFEADAEAAKSIEESIIEKLSSTRYQGEFLVPPAETADFLDSIKTKEGMASFTDQIVDLMLRDKGEDKTASAIGEAASPSDLASHDEPTTGLASVISNRVRM